MAAELLLALARCNIAASLAVLLVLPLRAPLRCWFGAQHAYAAWLIVPLAIAGSLMPTDIAASAVGPIERSSDQLLGWLGVGDHATVVTLVWIAGALIASLVVGWRHMRFRAAMGAGRAGPAAVGVLHPRLVLPHDFALRFTSEERHLVQAHELAHIERLDARYNAAAALATWLCWFNPLLHLAVRIMRQDQEQACDAAVLDRLPGARRLYAETLLRTHHAAAAPLLGCQWRSASTHPLVARVRMLRRRLPSQARRDIGVAVLLWTWSTTFGVAWALQPPVRMIEPPRMMQIDLAPPDAAETRMGDAVYRAIAAASKSPG
jgi:beta-lactamase regulating signal transducer with metallopeptidase domain